MVLTYTVDDSVDHTMQHTACIDSLDILWILQRSSFWIPVFVEKISLIFLIIYQLSGQQVLANLT